MQRLLPVLALALALLPARPAAAGAQESAAARKAQHQTRPGGWQILTDRIGADTTEIYFARMEPGFHVTTGPAALFYDPDTAPSGTFRVEATAHLFDPGGRNEAYGIFVGGDDLLGSYQRYTYFLVRRSGEFLIKRRVSATSTETLVDWTSHPAVVGWEGGDDGSESVRNSLAVEAGEDELVFFVNGEEVERLPRGDLPVSGVAGVRVNHALDLHFSEFVVGPLDDD